MAETVRTAEQIEAQNAYNRKRSKWFACILYPDEDFDHGKMISYVQNHPGLFPSFVYIVHDSDLDEEGVPKKTHTHLLFKRRAMTTPEAVVKFFGGWVHHIEAVTSYDSYIMYMLHDMPNCDEDGKHLYSPNDLVGDIKVISSAVIQNANSVYFFELLDILQSSQNGTCEDVFNYIKTLSSDKRQMYLDVYNSYSHILNRIAVEASKRKEIELQAMSHKFPMWYKVKDD